MAEVSEKAKEIINSLSKEELRLEKSKGIRSRFQNEGFAYLETRLATLEDEEQKQHEQATLDVAKQANNIADSALAVSKDSNKIAEKALETSNKSKKLAIWAIVISLVALIVQIALSK